MSAASQFFDSLKVYEGGKKFILSEGVDSRIGYLRDAGGRVSARVRESDWDGVEITDRHKEAFALFLAKKMA